MARPPFLGAGALSFKLYINLSYSCIGIPPVENLTVVDQCSTIRASWDITEGSCTHLSYNVTLLSSDGITLQGPLTTSDNVYNFTDVKTLNENFTVSVVPINDNARGVTASVIGAAVIDVSQGG